MKPTQMPATSLHPWILDLPSHIPFLTRPEGTDVTLIPGLKGLWAETSGDPRICIAVLDGPVDQSHPSLAAANLTRLESLVSGIAKQGPASQHGTHIASVIFGQHDGLVRGIAPGCGGLIVPVFADGSDGSIAPCSQIDLARAITQSVEHGANIINISGGELSSSNEPHPLLANAVRLCVENSVLIVAAVGNNGCECLHVPAAVPSALAVGAMDAQGSPLDCSNWGDAYQTQGIITLGENILGAVPGGGVTVRSGTSYASAIVSGVAALLLSSQLKHGNQPDPLAVREAILKSALPCNPHEALDCSRYLAGSLNILGAYALAIRGNSEVTDGHALVEGVQSGESTNVDLPQSKEVEMTESKTNENFGPEEGTVQLPEPRAQEAGLTMSSPESATPPLVKNAASIMPSHVHTADCGWG
jgi:cyanobactin maturation PatA/PatG family protease